ncbi:AT-rich interactive domain-containing protein 5A [Elgaria multicarinata webbii]|uniref:AT-rich interactive domain-containing protein 5A n=1 Tax=Elgaria multicarinata webbii TaxID=159646 RepID=UPI002FCD25FC
MAPSLKGKRKKKSIPMAETESENTPGPCPAEETAVGSPGAEEHESAPEKLDQVESPATKPEGPSEAEEKSPAEESGDEQTPSSAKEEEQTFLVNLYKFMKERHTPIERVPHLGFKQINLFKIYKVVEKLGAYELVTGRRLWKNVYDMLGGSPGSTSAATCTRRHYERLVLPYVRHLKGEDDKPLPPIKPRKQYKVSKESKGDQGSGGAEKKRAKKEKLRDQVLPETLKPDPVSAPKPAGGIEQPQPHEQAEGRLPLPNGREVPESQPLDGCHGNCRAHGCSEAYKRLFSSFYFKGNHGIMSPLAKKKLLAQVSKDESLYCHEKHLSHCPEYTKIRIRDSPGSDPEAGPKNPLVGHHHQETQKPGPEADASRGPAGSSQVSKANEGMPKVYPSPRESQMPQKADSGSSVGLPSPGPLIFRGYFHTSRSDVMKPKSCHPLRGPVEYYPGFTDFSESCSAYQPPGKDALLGSLPQNKQEVSEDQPEDLRRKPSQPLPCWRGDAPPSSAFQISSPGGKRGSSPFPHAKVSWVPPVANLAKVSPQVPKNGGPPIPQGQAGGSGPKKRASEEDSFLHGKKLKAVSPFVKEVESNSGRERSGSPGGQAGLAKPKATVPTSGFPVAPVPQVQDMYKGTMLRLPVNFGSPGEHLKGQPPSLVPSLSISPFIIPAFPTPLLTASVQPSDLCQPLGTTLVHYPTSYDSALRHRLYPVSTWHSQPAYAAPHVPAFHRNTKL